MKQLRTVFVDGNGIIAKKSSKEIVSLLQQDVNIVLRLHSDPDVIYASPCYYDGTKEVIWFDYTNAKNNLAQLVSVDANAEIVYYTGE
jgi:hypothetical protein